MLAVSKATIAILPTAQTSAASVIACAERHGDGGTQVLADAAGMHRGDAHSRVKTAQAIQAAPSVRDAVESGRVSQANAKRLADAIDKTGADVVESDGDLLAKAASMRPEQFTREARRWTADRQADGGESEYRRQRARRCVRMWNDDDGMVHLRGEFDPVTGKRIASRLRTEARRLLDTDKKHADDTQRRSFDQCMADALDNLTSTTGPRAPPTTRDRCSNPGHNPSPPLQHRPSPTRPRDRPAGPAHKPPEPLCTTQEPPATDRGQPRLPIPARRTRPAGTAGTTT